MATTWVPALVCVLLGLLGQVICDDSECTSYSYQSYGTGTCISTSECPGNVYLSNLCPNYAGDIKCCFTAFTNNTCHNQNPGGLCVDQADCPYADTSTGHCPNKPNGIKCCYGFNEPVSTFTTLETNSDSVCLNRDGVCIATSKCPNDDYTSGHCPTKPAGVKCCYSLDPCNMFTTVSRSGWGANAPTSSTTIDTPVEYVFIHHTTGTDCNSQQECVDRVKGIQDYHMGPKDWDDIGYSFLVGSDGRIYEGRGWDKEGSHTQGYNDQGLAFSFIGDFTSKQPTTSALQAVASAIQCGVKNGYIQSDYKLRGHKQMGTTACPGTTLYDNIVKKWPKWAEQ